MSDDWTECREEVTYQEARTVIDHQIDTLSDIDDKALRTVRLIVVLVGVLATAIEVNYPDLLPRRIAPRSLRSGLPASASERAGTVPTAVPDSTGVVPRWVVRSVPLLPVRHSATTAVARFLSRLNNAGRVASVLLPSSTAGVSKAMPYSGSETDEGRCIPSPLAPSALAEEGGLAPCTAQAKSQLA